MDSQQTETESQVTRRPRTRIGHDRSRLVRALEDFARATGASFDPPTLAQLADVTEDEYRAICDGLVAALASSINGIGKSTVPTYDVQLSNFRVWQHQRPQYFWWDDAAMEALRRKLEQLGPHCELIPIFAMSIQVKLSSGKLTLLNRRGEETRT